VANDGLYPLILSQQSREVLNGKPIPPYSSGTLIDKSPYSPAFFKQSTMC
jgi:hypothetical protein